MRKILLPIDLSDYTKTAFSHATAMGKTQKIVIEGIVILDILDVLEQATTFFPLPQGKDGHLRKEEELVEHIRQLAVEEVNDFKASCKKENIHCKAKIFEGRPDFVIEKEGIYNDLIIMGMRNFFHIETKKRPETSVKDVVGHTGTPILAVTKQYKPIKKVVAAFDGSNTSMKAIQQFVNRMTGMDYEITILTKNENESIAAEQMKQVEDYLFHHGVKNIHKRWISKSLRKTIEEEFLPETDLIIVGKHSKDAVTELFVGSFTKYMIDLNKVSLFIGH